MTNNTKIIGVSTALFLMGIVVACALTPIKDHPLINTVPLLPPTQTQQVGQNGQDGTGEGVDSLPNGDANSGVPIKDFVLANSPMKIGGVTTPVVTGKVVSLIGTSFTAMIQVPGAKGAGESLYTIDGTNAQVLKNSISASVSDIQVDDRVVINGVVSGTNINAKSIIASGNMPPRNQDSGMGGGEIMNAGNQPHVVMSGSNGAGISSDYGQKEHSAGFFVKLKRFFLGLFGK